MESRASQSRPASLSSHVNCKPTAMPSSGLALRFDSSNLNDPHDLSNLVASDPNCVSTIGHVKRGSLQCEAVAIIVMNPDEVHKSAPPSRIASATHEGIIVR